MIATTTDEMEKRRTRDPNSLRYKGSPVGSFIFRHKNNPTTKEVCICVVAHDGREMDYLLKGVHGPRWEHVSVSVIENGRNEPSRLPTWEEMNFVKDQFWLPEETVLQFHPKRSEYVNVHPWVLHLWRIVGTDHPLPQNCLI